jgi:predicted nuclease of predicted toxin-antitoxin system
LIQGVPDKLFLVTTGNITNRELISLIEKDFEMVIDLLEIYDLIEMDNDRITVHEK